MRASLTPGADGGHHDAADPAAQGYAEPQRVPARLHDGNFVIGCLVGAVAATVLWAVLGYVAYSLL